MSNIRLVEDGKPSYVINNVQYAPTNARQQLIRSVFSIYYTLETLHAANNQQEQNLSSLLQKTNTLPLTRHGE